MMHCPDFKKARIWVVDNVMLDEYWHGLTSRISPEAPVPVVRVEASEARAGGTCWVAFYRVGDYLHWFLH